MLIWHSFNYAAGFRKKPDLESVKEELAAIAQTLQTHQFTERSKGSLLLGVKAGLGRVYSDTHSAIVFCNNIEV